MLQSLKIQKLNYKLDFFPASYLIYVNVNLSTPHQYLYSALKN